MPLAEAWDSGAYSWDSDTRRRYANDLGYEHSLVAVWSSSNRQKGAGDPGDWLPPLVSSRCWYAEAWIAVKTRWEFSVDTAELQALRSVVSQCGDWELGSAPVQASPVLATATTVPAATTTTTLAAAEDLCHPAYIPCLPNLPGDAVNCGDLSSAQNPFRCARSVLIPTAWTETETASAAPADATGAQTSAQRPCRRTKRLRVLCGGADKQHQRLKIVGPEYCEVLVLCLFEVSYLENTLQNGTGDSGPAAEFLNPGGGLCGSVVVKPFD